jgi:hypothetical protein
LSIKPGSVASTNNGPGDCYRIAAANQAEHQAWDGRCDAFTRVSDHVESLIGAREGAAVIPLRG